MTRHDLVPAAASDSRLALTEPELVDWGRRLGRQMSPPLLVTLAGDLGTGKTTLARAICEGLGVTEDVTSPTFSLVHTYEAPKGTVYHIDLYRLDGPRDLQNIGWDDIVRTRAVILVEWPERAGDLLPPDHLPIELRYAEHSPDRRILYAGGHLGYQSGAS